MMATCTKLKKSYEKAIDQFMTRMQKMMKEYFLPVDEISEIPASKSQY